MDFYCPQCQKSVDVSPETTVTTKLNQTAYKAHCPVCNQDMAVYGSQTSNQESVATKTDADPHTAQAEVDQALREFGTSTQ